MLKWWVRTWKIAGIGHSAHHACSPFSKITWLIIYISDTDLHWHKLPQFLYGLQIYQHFPLIVLLDRIPAAFLNRAQETYSGWNSWQKHWIPVEPFILHLFAVRFAPYIRVRYCTVTIPTLSVIAEMGTAQRWTSVWLPSGTINGSYPQKGRMQQEMDTI